MPKKVASVLLIDDSEATNNYNKRIIMAFGLAERVDIALNGQLAFEHLTACATDDLPTLILLDINMPVMDGFQFMEAYCLNQKHTQTQNEYIF